jgi:hypothetical protein
MNRIHLPEKNSSRLSIESKSQLGGLIGHELSHLEASKLREVGLEKSAALLENNEEAARIAFIRTRIAEEIMVRKTENQIRSEIRLLSQPAESGKNEIVKASNNTSKEAAASAAYDPIPVAYFKRFEADFAKFKGSKGRWRPGKDFALLSKEEVERLKTETNSFKVVSLLYPELPKCHQKAVADRIAKALEGTGDMPFDLIYKMPRKAFERSLTWITLTEYLKAKRLVQDTDFTSQLEKNPNNQEWTSEIRKASDECKERTDAAKKEAINNCVPVIEELAIKLTELENQKHIISEQNRASYESGKADLKKEFGIKQQEIEANYDLAENRVFLKLKALYPHAVSHNFVQKKGSGQKETALSLQISPKTKPYEFAIGDLVRTRNHDSMRLDADRSYGGMFDFTESIKAFCADRNYTHHNNALYNGRQMIYGQTNHERSSVSQPVETEAADAIKESGEYKRYYEIAGPLEALREKYGSVVNGQFYQCIELISDEFAAVRNLKYGSQFFQPNVSASFRLNFEPTGLASQDIYTYAWGKIPSRFAQPLYDFSHSKLPPPPKNLFERTPVQLDSKRRAGSFQKYKTINDRDSSHLELKKALKIYNHEIEPHVQRREMELKSLNRSHRDKLVAMKSALEERMQRSIKDLDQKGTEVRQQTSTFINQQVRSALEKISIQQNVQNNTHQRIIKKVATNPGTIRWLPEHNRSAEIFDLALASSAIFGHDATAWHESRTLTKCFEKKQSEVEKIPLHKDLREPFIAELLLKSNSAGSLASSWLKLSLETREKLKCLTSKEQEETIHALSMYGDAANVQFARESAKWALGKSEYQVAEKAFIQSQSVPDAFPTDRTWTSGDYVGRFLPRSDSRNLFMGNHTNSCMRIGGLNERGVIWAQNSPDAGFFVVENAKTQEIIAGSRVWTNPESKGTCFNSIQSKGLAGRWQTVLDIYKQAAHYLTTEGQSQKVTVGGVLEELSFKDGLFSIGRNSFVVPPADIRGHTDCELFQKQLAWRARSSEQATGNDN